MSTSPRWDMLCEVVDNLGDAAVLWRLARQLAAEHGIRPRLFIDRPEVLALLVPGASPGHRIEGVEIAADAARLGDRAEVVISGFLARLPVDARRHLLARPGSLFIQIEYLSAEAWIDGFHGLPSPGPDGLVEHYFYPGFTPASGGLLRERDLLARRDAFAADTEASQRLLQALGVVRPTGARVASLFTYPDPPLAPLARALANAPDLPPLVLVAPGAPSATDAPLARRLHELSGGRLLHVRVPFLTQRDYDRLLWSCDVNIVRGEDSWIRALWAGRPMLWRAYPQAAGTDRVKLEAFLDRLGAPPSAQVLSAAHRWWNAPDDDAAPILALLRGLPDAGATVSRLASALARQPAAGQKAPHGDLASRLVAFVHARRPARVAARKL